jgi:flagellar biosynthetic protein FliS
MNMPENDPRLAYQQSATRGANPVRLTILLYEQIVQDLGRAHDSISRRDAEACSHEIGHAVAVIGYLQATLRPEAGPSVARNLAHFYTMLREQLMEAQVRSSRDLLDQLRAQVLEMREAWLKVEAETTHLQP